MAIEVRLVPEIVIVSEALTEPDVAVTVALPFAIAFTTPALLTATVPGEADHETLLVKFCVVPSLKVPVAVNCLVLPMVKDGLDGVIDNEAKVAGSTVRFVDALREPEVAVIAADPVDKAEIRPVPLTAATVMGEMVQTTLPVTS
jgi:hypothetical protein